MQPPSQQQLVDSVPEWTGEVLTIEPLDGGITNRNFVVSVLNRRYVVRLPGERTELLAINRVHEAEAARRAAELGIGPPIVGELAGVGTLITEMVGGRHLESEEFVERIDEVVGLLLRFHNSESIAGRFPIHRVVQWHARDAATHGVNPPKVFDRLTEVSQRIESAFATSPMSPVPCHNDLLPSNVLFDGGRVWLLDFEYAGMNNAFFDLGNLSVNCGLTPDADERLLALYWGAVTPSRWARLQLMKVMSEFREGMWAVVQQAISTLDTDFVAYADERLGNCERLASSPEFAAWLNDASNI
jgi:thiamine kinase-like enzyme